MYISARVDYATRALLALATAESGAAMTGEAVASSQALPVKFVENILVELRRGGFVASQRGSSGGYRLARPASEITVAQVIRALEGPLAEVRGERPERMRYEGAAEHLQEVWIAVRAALRRVLEGVSIADIASGKLPRAVTTMLTDPDAWAAR